VFAITFVPWALFDFCPRHAETHEHHGTCNSDMMGDSHESVTKLSATPCKTFSVTIDWYSAPDCSPKTTFSQVAIFFIFYQFIDGDLPDTSKFITKRSDNTSDPPLGINALRGPPFV